MTNDDKNAVPHGALVLMILRTLDSMGPLHGYGLARRIEQISRDMLALNQGTIYPVLMRLEQESKVSTNWGISENNRRAKYYAITREGKRYLDSEVREWARITALVGRFMDLEKASSS